MYIITRSFRGLNGPLLAGSTIDPANIKDFRYRLQQRHIVEVTEHNFEQYQAFFKDRYGIKMPDITVPKKEVVQPKAVAKITN